MKCFCTLLDVSSAGDVRESHQSSQDDTKELNVNGWVSFEGACDFLHRLRAFVVVYTTVTLANDD